MGSIMHIVALIEQKSRQNGIDYGIGRFRCEEGQFGTFRFKILSSARLTKYCHPFSEGDVVTLAGQFSYETVDKEEGFMLNVSVATPFPLPSSGCWEPEEIPLSAPYLSFNTQPVSGSLRQIENCQFVRTKSLINSGYSRRHIDTRFRIGYQTDNDRWDNMASNWDAYLQFFISGFLLHVDNGEIHVEATEIEADPLAKKYAKGSNLSSSTVPGVSPLAKNLTRLLEQEKSSLSLGPFNNKNHSFEQQQQSTTTKPEKKSSSLRPLAPKNVSGPLQQSQNQSGMQPPIIDQTNQDLLSKDIIRGLQAYQHLMQRMQQPTSHAMFPSLSHVPLSEQPPSAEQIAELIADQGTRQDLSSPAVGVQHKRPSYSVWQLSGQDGGVIYHQRDKVQVVNQNDREKSSSYQNERDKPSKSSSSQVTYPQQEQLVKSPTHYTSPQNERESTPSHEVNNKNDSVRSSRAESESSESMEPEQNKKSSKKTLPEDKTKSVRPTSRATLGNRFIVYEPKVSQESEGSKQEGTPTSKRGRKSKNTSNSRPAKKAKNKKTVTEVDTATTNPEEQAIDSTNGSPKNSTDKDPKNVSEKSENTTSKDEEANEETKVE